MPDDSQTTQTTTADQAGSQQQTQTDQAANGQTTPQTQTTPEPFPLNGMFGIEAQNVEEFFTKLVEKETEYSTIKKRFDDSQNHIKKLETENASFRSQPQQQQTKQQAQSQPFALPPMPDPDSDPERYKMYIQALPMMTQKYVESYVNNFKQDMIYSSIIQRSKQNEIDMERSLGKEKWTQVKEAAINLGITTHDPQSGEMLFTSIESLHQLAKLIPDTKKSAPDTKKIISSLQKVTQMGNQADGGSGNVAQVDFERDLQIMLDPKTPLEKIDALKKQYKI